MTMRALVLARGLGSRMRQASAVTLDPQQASAADAGLKAMMPFRRPFLDFVLQSLADAGLREASLVLGPEHESVRAYYRRLAMTRLRVTFVEQAQPLGTADAVLAARLWAGPHPFMVLNADNLYPVDVLARLAGGTHPAVPGFDAGSLGFSEDRLGAFGLLEPAPSGELARIVEKPGAAAIRAAGPRALISMNLWRFDERIFDACAEVPLSARHERELPQAVQLAVSRGMSFELIPVRGTVLDLSRREDVPHIAQVLEGKAIDL
jgi:glucose-1-phosphate thymidylyltransferase